MIDLGTLPGTSDSTAFGINERGDIVGISGDRAVLWRGGRVVDLAASTGSAGAATDVNEQGDVVGAVQVAGTNQAFLWQRGRMTMLPPLPGDQGSGATAVNDRGEVVGYSDEIVRRPVLWRSGGRPVDLTGTGMFEVTGLDNSGRLIGTGPGPTDQGAVPVLWAGGRTTTLTVRPGTASAVNDRGEVAGYVYVGFGPSFVWRHGELTDIPLLPGLPDMMMMQAHAINNRGQVVGDAGYESFLWHDGTLSVLPHLYGHGPTANDINDRGQIVGSIGTSPDNLRPHAVLLTPTR
ncbi:MAG TPA: hypothetical protein VMU51_17125 [Mycobacteriales bacterium]|nr:hypothetical protein [Mycobacteriales bacterium]